MGRALIGSIVVLAVTLAAFAANGRGGNDIINALRERTTFGTLGIVAGQTARLSAVRAAGGDGGPQLCQVDLAFFDTAGQSQGEPVSVNLAPGEATLFDLRHSDIAQVSAEPRAQIYAVVDVTSEAQGGKPSCAVAMSIELFDDADGRTRIYQGAFAKNTNLATHCCCTCCKHDARGNCLASICNCIAEQNVAVECPAPTSCPKS